jgi:hypothetical protein
MHSPGYKGLTYVLVAVHAQTLNLINNPRIVLILLRARISDLAPHVLEEILCETLLLCHFEFSMS